MKKPLLIFALSLILFSLCINLSAQENQFDDPRTIELITFETESLFLHQATPTTDIWQIGQPSKASFSEAYSGTNAITTDTLNPYPANNHSWFDLILSHENGVSIGYSMHISFQHKLNTDSLCDGGYITISYDHGHTWENIIYDTLYNNSNTAIDYIWDMTPADWDWSYTTGLYQPKDTLHNGECGFSGDFKDWTFVEFGWDSYPVKKGNQYIDTILLRFNFISDTYDTKKEGWLIDNIRIYGNDNGGSINENPMTSNIEIYPNPIADIATISTKNQSIIENIELYNLNGQLIKQEVVGNQEYIFKKGRIESGVYFVRCNFKEGSETIKLIIK